MKIKRDARKEEAGVHQPGCNSQKRDL